MLKSNQPHKQDYFVIVADSMLFSSALVLFRAIAPLLTMSFPTLSDAH